MTLHTSVELRQVLAEAEDIANQVNQKLTSAHLLLGLFTVENRAKILLNEKEIDEDLLLEHVHSIDDEPKGTIRAVRRKTAEIAAGCNAKAIDCLHLLIALCGMRQTVAYDLLKLSGLHVPQFRNTALSYVTTSLPRRLTVKKRNPSQTNQSSYAPPAESNSAYQAQPSAPPAVVEHDEDNRPEVGVRLAAPRPGEMAEDGTPDELPRNQWDLDPSQYPLLSKIGRNLTSIAAQGHLDPLIGRQKELIKVIDTLLKRRANNPLLVGEPGVGKTAIVEGLALGIVQNDPQMRALAKRKIIELDVANLLSGTQLRGAFSEKLQQIREEVREAKGQVIIFFDEIHTLMGAGATGEGPQDAANELKSSLARGEFPCIGATTHDEYRRFVEQDAALSRRFQLIQIPEPSSEATIEILKGVTQEYSDHHGVSYDEEALEAAVHLASRYITDRCLPDKAISLLDLAGSRARRSGRSLVDRQAVARVVANVANIPVERLLMTDAERLLNMEQILGLQIIGHTSVLRRIAQVIRRNYAGFAHKRPIGSFLFLGSTGVGKTETARALAQFLFGNRESLIKLDMSEYTEAHSVSRLVGSPPGYVGHQEGGQLSETIRRKPYTIVLFDEIEKAHQDVQQLLLQILDEGCLTDAKGRTVDFCNTVVILTSNQGAYHLGKPDQGQIGFGTQNSSQTDLQRDVLSKARKGFSPELWARMDEQLFFRPLQTEDLIAIANLLIRDSANRLEQERKIQLQVTTDLSSYLVKQGCIDTTLGARPLRSAVQRYIEEPIAEAILEGRFKPDDQISVSLQDKKLSFSPQ